MPAITTTLVAMSGLGLSVHQIIKQGEAKKEAIAAGEAAVAKARGITEQNKLLALQAPTEGIKFAKEKQRQRDATLIPTLQKDVRTALGGTTTIAQIGAEEDLELAAQTADAMFDRDVLVLGEDAAIEKRKADREAKIAEMEIEGAGLAARDASEGQIRAAESAIALGGELASGSGAWEKKDRKERVRSTKEIRRRGERGRRQYERKFG